jgi:hypothetical protein
LNKIDEEKKEAEINKIFHIILDAIPTDVYMENIIIALNRLAAEFAWELSEPDNEDFDNSRKGDSAYLN